VKGEANSGIAVTEQNTKDQAPSSPRRINHGLFFTILIIFALFAFIYSLFLPLGEAADEAEHFAVIRFIAENRRPPLTPEEKQTSQVSV